MPRHDQSSQYRQVLTRIARQRRRLDRHANSLIDHSLLIGSWRTYVEQHPARALAAAAGVGMTLSLLASGGSRYAGRIGSRLYEAATGAAWGEVWKEVRTLINLLGDEWSDSGLSADGNDDLADDDLADDDLADDELEDDDG
jgi:hypothetical protein